MVKIRSGKAIVPITLRLPLAVSNAVSKALDQARKTEPNLSLNEWFVRAIQSAVETRG